MTETNKVIRLPFAGTVPAENLSSSLGNFEAVTEHQAYAKTLAETFVDIEAGPAGLLVVGSAGSGKSHLAVGIARRHGEQGGRAAFVSFDGDGLGLASIPGAPRATGWWGYASELVAAYDLIVVDDVPGSMMPGPRYQLRDLVLASYDAGTKLVITSNQPVAHIVEQIAETPERGDARTDKAIAVSERMAQVWQTLEFEGESYRATQPKW